MIKIKFCVICLLCVVFSLLPTTHNILQTVHALDSTQSATQSADFKAKLKALQDEIASKAVQLKNEISKKLQNKAYVGFVKSVSLASLNIEVKNATKTATINEFTQFTSKGKIIKSVTIGDWVAALGDVDETGNLTAKKIVKMAPPKEIEEKIIYGIVLSSGDNRITIRDKAKQNYTLAINNDTIFKTDKNQDTAFEDIIINKPIIVAGTLLKDKIIQARFIYIIKKIN